MHLPFVGEVNLLQALVKYLALVGHYFQHHHEPLVEFLPQDGHVFVQGLQDIGPLQDILAQPGQDWFPQQGTFAVQRAWIAAQPQENCPAKLRAELDAIQLELGVKNLTPQAQHELEAFEFKRAQAPDPDELARIYLHIMPQQAQIYQYSEVIKSRGASVCHYRHGFHTLEDGSSRWGWGTRPTRCEHNKDLASLAEGIEPGETAWVLKLRSGQSTCYRAEVLKKP